jgi:ribosomal protein S18 acetylase RimI-like enzyme
VGIEIGEAVASDAEAVIALWQACGLTRPWNDPQQDFDRALSWPASTILVAREGAALLGSTMIGYDGHRGWVYYLAVSPAHQRSGLGHRIMEAAANWLRDRGAPKIQLMVRTSNAATLDFYSALGFERQDTVTLGKFFDAGDAAQ